MKLKKKHFFWAVFVLALLNLAILLLSNGGGFSKNNLAKAKLSIAVMVETVIMLVMGAIPGLDLVALVLLTPILFYNFVVRLVPIMRTWGATPGGSSTMVSLWDKLSSSKDVNSGAPQTSTDAASGIWTTPQVGNTPTSPIGSGGTGMA